MTIGAETSALDRLIEAVDAGRWDAHAATRDGVLPKAQVIDNDWVDCYTLAALAFRGSLASAKRLHEELLPRWRVAGIRQEDNGFWWVELREGYITSYTNVVIAPKGFDAVDPARAWLLAILKAYRSIQ